MHNETEKLTILEEFLGLYSKRGQEFLFYCPNCNHYKKKLSVNLSKDKYKCWICENRGRSVRRLVFRYGGPAAQAQWNELCGQVDLSTFELEFGESPKVYEEPVVSLPKEYKPLLVQSGFRGAEARAYLKERGVSKQDIGRWKIGYATSGEYENRVIVPSFNRLGRINYFVSRSYKDDWIPYKNPKIEKEPIIFNELNLDWGQDVIIVEGVFDAIVAGNAVPILGSSLAEDARTFQQIALHDTPIYVALDPDAHTKAMKLIMKLLEHNVEVFYIDVGEFEDVGEMTKEQFLEAKRVAEPMSQEICLVEMIKRAV